MRLAAEQPWSDIEITDIAREAGVSLAEFRDAFPSKGAVLGGFARMIDAKVLAGVERRPRRRTAAGAAVRRADAPPRRDDALQAGLRRIAFALRGDPLALAALNGVALNSQRFMLASAGIATEGPLGGLKLQGTVIAFARTMETWLDDDDPSLARTMARLDARSATASGSWSGPTTCAGSPRRSGRSPHPDGTPPQSPPARSRGRAGPGSGRRDLSRFAEDSFRRTTHEPARWSGGSTRMSEADFRIATTIPRGSPGDQSKIV